VPSWDNSARRKEGAGIFRGSTPELFEEWVRTARQQARTAGDDSLFFVNAWNEWAEGNHLEPDLDTGHAYLDAYRRALQAEDVAGRAG
jgi:lipopolysaccharide biosynthesis protein